MSIYQTSNLQSMQQLVTQRDYLHIFWTLGTYEPFLPLSITREVENKPNDKTARDLIEKLDFIKTKTQILFAQALCNGTRQCVRYKIVYPGNLPLGNLVFPHFFIFRNQSTSYLGEPYKARRQGRRAFHGGTPCLFVKKKI